MTKIMNKMLILEIILAKIVYLPIFESIYINGLFFY